MSMDKIILPLVEGFAPAFVVLDYIRRQRDADQAILDKAVVDKDTEWSIKLSLEGTTLTTFMLEHEEQALKEQAEEILRKLGEILASYLGGK
jgi:hypothetical protein